MLERLLDALASLPLVPTYLVLMALSALENVFPPVPADTAVALGAFLARRGEISVVPLAVLCWLANLASACGTYLARPPPRPRLLPGRLGPQDHAARGARGARGGLRALGDGRHLREPLPAGAAGRRSAVRRGRRLPGR